MVKSLRPDGTASGRSTRVGRLIFGAAVLLVALVSTLQILLLPYFGGETAMKAWLDGLAHGQSPNAGAGAGSMAQLSAAVSSLSGNRDCLCEEGYRQGQGICTVSSCDKRIVWLFANDNFTYELERHGVEVVPWRSSLMDTDLAHHLRVWTRDAARFWDSQAADFELTKPTDKYVKDASGLGGWVKPLRESFRKAPSRKKYDRLASGISEWRLEDTAAILSDANHNGHEIWPGLAVLPNALVHPDGVVESPVKVRDADKIAPSRRAFERLNETKRFTFKGCQGPSKRHLALQKARVSEQSQVAHHKRAASIGNIIAGAYFHFVVETLTRITPLLPELRNGSNGRGGAALAHGLVLHMSEGDVSAGFAKEYMSILGVPSKAITSGAMTAETLLVPEATSCGGAATVQVHLLRRELWRLLRPPAATHMAPPALAADRLQQQQALAASPLASAAGAAAAAHAPNAGAEMAAQVKSASRPWHPLVVGGDAGGSTARAARLGHRAQPLLANSSIARESSAREASRNSSSRSSISSQASNSSQSLVALVGPYRDAARRAPLPPPVRPAPPHAACNILVLKRETGSGTRTLSNHGSLLATVREEARAYGCSVSEHNGKGSLRSQLLAFAGASAVVAVHGAGLANLIVMPPGGLVIEIMPMRPDVNACYMDLAVKLRLRYSTVMEPSGEMYHGAFAVNVQRVKHLLQLFPPHGARERRETAAAWLAKRQA